MVSRARFSFDNVPENPWWAKLSSLTVFLLLLSAAKVWIGVHTGFIDDEAYYTLWAHYPIQPGYFDHPPAVAWFVEMGTWLFGDTVFASRFIGIISTIPAGLAIYRAGYLLSGDKRVGALGAYWFLLTLGGFLSFMVITPDAPSVLFWVLAFWAAAELHVSGKGWWWLVFGLFAGLGLFSKYTGFFLGAGIVLWLLVYRENRHWFLSPWLYAGGALALALFVPVIYWNLQHDFSSLEFQLGRTTRGLDLGWYDWRFIPELIGGQFGLMLIGVATTSAAAIWRWRVWLADARLGLAVVTLLPFVIYLLLISIHSRAQGNWFWPAYGQLSVLAAWFVLRADTPGAFARWSRRTAYFSQTALSLFVLALVAWHSVFQFISVGADDKTRDMHGWPQVAAQISAISERENAPDVFGDRYGHLSQLHSFARFGGHDYRVLPYKEFFRYGFMDLPASDDMIKWPALLVVQKAIDDKDDALPDDLSALNVGFIMEIARLSPRGEPLARILVYRVPRPQTPVFSAQR